MLIKKIILTGFVLICVGAWVGCASSQAQTATDLTNISGNQAASEIGYLVSIGAMSGYSDGTLRPDQDITRAEFITIINRAFAFNPEAPIYFGDVMPEDWYYREIARAVAAGYIPVYPDGKLGPNQPITREEAAFVMAAVLHLDTSKAHDLAHFADDLSISSQMRDAVAAMAMSDFMHGSADMTFRPMDSISRAGAAVIITKGLKLNFPSAAGTYNVKDFGAQGDGITDDTRACQSAVNYVYLKGGGTVYIPDGKYLIDPDASIQLRNDLKLNLADNATLKAQATISDNFAVIRITNIANVAVTGGEIIGERKTHLGVSGQWGHGIKITGSNNVYIADISISDCWGDGIYIGSTSAQNYSANVTIERFNIDKSRRNGISLISGKQVTIKNGMISNTNGLPPTECGMDLEPNSTTEFLQNILIENVTVSHNANYGLKFSFAQYVTTTNEVTITLKNFVNIHNDKGAYNDWKKYQPRNPLFHVTI